MKIRLLKLESWYTSLLFGVLFAKVSIPHSPLRRKNDKTVYTPQKKYIHPSQYTEVKIRKKKKKNVLKLSEPFELNI